MNNVSIVYYKVPNDYEWRDGEIWYWRLLGAEGEILVEKEAGWDASSARDAAEQFAKALGVEIPIREGHISTTKNVV